MLFFFYNTNNYIYPLYVKSYIYSSLSESTSIVAVSPKFMVHLLKVMSCKQARRARRAKTNKKNRCIRQTHAAITSRSQKNVTVVKKGNNKLNSGLATIQITRLRKQLQKAQSQIKVLQQKCNSLQRKSNTVADAIEFIDDFVINELITNKIKFVFVVLIAYDQCCLGEVLFLIQEQAVQVVSYHISLFSHS